MKKIFLIATLILTMFTATAFAAENENAADSENKADTEKVFVPYEYTSETYGFKILCPTKPIVVVNPFEDPYKKGELLVFVNDGIDVLFGYIVELDSFDTNKVPNFNSSKKTLIDSFIEKKREEQLYNFVELQNITPDNKGIVMVTSKEVKVTNDKGEVELTAVANQQTALAFFRSRSGRCISIQLLSADLDKSDYQDFLKSISTFQDATDLSMPQDTKDKKSKDKKNKKSKDKKSKDKKSKDKKDKK
jgi:hypothetical protein